MGSPVERWSRRFRARVDAVAATRAGSPSEQYARELDATLLLAWFCLGLAGVLVVAAAVVGVPWWVPVAVAGAGASFARAHRRARRRGGPNPT